MVELIDIKTEHRYNIRFKADSDSQKEPVDIDVKEVPFYGVIVAQGELDAIDLNGLSYDVIVCLEYIKKTIYSIIGEKAFYGQCIGGTENLDVDFETPRGSELVKVDTYIVFYGGDPIPQIHLYGQADKLIYLLEIASTMFKIGDTQQRYVRGAQQNLTPEQLAAMEGQKH